MQGGTKDMKPPRWATRALLVDGKLLWNGKPDYVMRARPEGCPDELNDQEVQCVQVNLVEVGESSMEVRSVVAIPRSGKEVQKNAVVQRAINNIKKEFGNNVLSGKLAKNPPVRGPFGMAKI